MQQIASKTISSLSPSSGGGREGSNFSPEAHAAE
jgi:hypothetical protein